MIDRALLRLVAVVAALALAGCGGDSDDSGGQTGNNTPPPSSAPPPTANQAPTISGTPAASVMQGSPYLFQPSAADANGDTLTFSIVNRPPWATFNTTTGRLTGTPSAADVANYQDIRISVSDGQATANLPPFSIAVIATASGTATLTWTPPTQRSDGSALTNLAGYRIYWGTTQGVYPQSETLNNPGLTSYVISQLTPATYFFVATAFDAMGNESQFSNVASKIVQ